MLSERVQFKPLMPGARKRVNEAIYGERFSGRSNKFKVLKPQHLRESETEDNKQRGEWKEMRSERSFRHHNL